MIFFFFFVVNSVIHWNEKALGSHVFPIPIPFWIKFYVNLWGLGQGSFFLFLYISNCPNISCCANYTPFIKLLLYLCWSSFEHICRWYISRLLISKILFMCQNSISCTEYWGEPVIIFFLQSTQSVIGAKNLSRHDRI